MKPQECRVDVSSLFRTSAAALTSTLYVTALGFGKVST